MLLSKIKSPENLQLLISRTGGAKMSKVLLFKMFRKISENDDPTVNKEKFVKAWNSMKKNSQLNNEKEIEGSVVLSNWMFNFQGQRKSGFE